MSSSQSPETQPGFSPEALEAERRSAQLAHEALHAVEYHSTPNPDQLKATQEWMSGLSNFDSDGNALNEQGQTLATAQELAEVESYFANDNWLLSDAEKAVLANLKRNPDAGRRRKRDRDGEPEPQDKVDIQALPTELGKSIERALGSEKTVAVDKIAKLQLEADKMLSLDRSVQRKASEEASQSHTRNLEPAAARVASDTYDLKLSQYSAAIRAENSDFDTLDPVKQASLMQAAVRTAEADAQAAKENYIYEQTERTSTPAVQPRSERLAAAWKHSHGAELTSSSETLETLLELKVITARDIDDLKKMFYAKPGEDLGEAAKSLLAIVGDIPGFELPRSSEVRARQSLRTKVRGRGHRNRAEDKVIGEHVRERDAAFELALARLKDYRTTLLKRGADLKKDQEAASYGAISERLVAAIDTKPTKPATAEGLVRLLSNDEHAAQALELIMARGNSLDSVLETELHISKPRREALVNQLVAAGVLGPEKANGERRVLIKPVNIPAMEQPESDAEPSTEPVEAAPETTPTEPAPEAKATPEAPETTGLDKTAFAEIRGIMKKHISEAISSYLDDKRKQDPSATLTKQEEAQLAEEVRQEVLEESIVKRFDINDKDASYQQAIKEGARILGKELLGVVQKDAASIFREAERIVRLRVNDDKSDQPAPKKWAAARKYVWEQTLEMLPVEDREPTARVFRELKKASDERRVAARDKKTAGPAPGNPSKPQPGTPRRNPEARETPRQRRERIDAERAAALAEKTRFAKYDQILES